MSKASAQESVKDDVKEYYGKVLQGTKDLKTTACCTMGVKIPEHVRDALAEVHDEVMDRYYGCGLVIPESLEGMKVLDLGCGAGRDCYILSRLVEQSGQVTGIDMTDEQLEVAKKFIDYHTKKFGYATPNISFIKGFIERLNEAGIPDNFYNIVVSNCVINLSPDKKAVIEEAYRVLEEGGELYFSDVYVDKDLPDDVRKHKVLWGECIAGALWWQDLIDLAKEIGFSRPRIYDAKIIDITDEELLKVVGDAKFASVTYRLFKLPEEMLDTCQVIYDASITGCPDKLIFDYNHTFKAGEPVEVDAELSTILRTSRFEDDFTFAPATKRCCTGNSKKDDLIDPFKFIEEFGGKPGKAPSSGGGCCPAPSDKAPDAAVAAPKKDCGEKPASGGCCGGKTC